MNARKPNAKNKKKNFHFFTTIHYSKALWIPLHSYSNEGKNIAFMPRQLSQPLPPPPSPMLSPPPFPPPLPSLEPCDLRHTGACLRAATAFEPTRNRNRNRAGPAAFRRAGCAGPGRPGPGEAGLSAFAGFPAPPPLPPLSLCRQRAYSRP